MGLLLELVWQWPIRKGPSFFDADIGRHIDNAIRLHVHRSCLEAIGENVGENVQERITLDLKGGMFLLREASVIRAVQRNVLDTVRVAISANMENSLSSLP